MYSLKATVTAPLRPYFWRLCAFSVQKITWLQLSECKVILWNTESQIIFKSIVKHQTIISAAETSPKVETTLLCKNGYSEKPVLCQKVQYFPCSLSHTIFSNLTNIWYKHVLSEMSSGEYFRFPTPAIVTVVRNSLTCKFTAKIDVPIEHYMLPLLMLK